MLSPRRVSRPLTMDASVFESPPKRRKEGHVRSVRVQCDAQAKATAWAQPPVDLLTAAASQIANNAILPVLGQTSVQRETFLQVTWNRKLVWIRERDTSTDLVKFPKPQRTVTASQDWQGHAMLRNSDGRGKVVYYKTLEEAQSREMPQGYILDGICVQVRRFDFDAVQAVDGYAFVRWFENSTQSEGYVKQCHMIKLEMHSARATIVQGGPQQPPAAACPAAPAPQPPPFGCCRMCGQTGTAKYGPQCDQCEVILRGVAIQGVPILLKNLIPKCPHAGFAPSVFVSHHNTTNSQPTVSLWLGEQMLSRGFEAVASAPRFNTSGGDYERGVIKLNMPCYSPQLTEAVMRIFTIPEVAAVAQEMGVQIPVLTLNPTIQRRLPRVRELINVLRSTHINTTPDMNAIAKLEQFLQFLENLQQGDIRDLRQWVSELDQRCGPGWQENLHMKTVLKIFGFSDQVCNFVNALQVTDRVTWGEYSLRWLAKGFETFGIQGSLSDVVNLICAMLGMRMPADGADVPVGEVVRQICHFENILRQRQFHLLPWEPSHMIHDAELDDVLALILVTCVNIQMRQMKPFVLAQLPEDASLGRLRQAFEMRMQNTQVYTDLAARNVEAIRLFWSL